MDDTRIIDLYFERSETAVRATAEKYGKRLFLLAHNITADRPDAEECVNDTYLAAWNTIPPKEPRDYLFAFLARIARCKAIDLCRRRMAEKRAATVLELTEELAACIPEASADGEIAEALNGFLATLDKETRAVFLRRYFYCDSVKTIARRFAFGESKVKSMLMRTREKLRVYLTERGVTV